MPVIFDKAGNLFGTTVGGGQQGCEVGCGVVYELTPSVLYTFQGRNDGGEPYAGLVFDSVGNLYRATALAGAGGGGTVFELTPTNGNWVFTLAYSLIGYGEGPHGNLILDATGDLYGTTLGDGAYGWGNVFRLTPATGGWTYDSLYDFTRGSDGAQAYGSLVLDSSGNLYGTTSYGGANSKGVVFDIRP